MASGRSSRPLSDRILRAGDRAPDGTLTVALTDIVRGIWGVFLIDYAVRLYLAKRRRRWFVRTIHGLLIVALPMLRPLRLLRLITLLRTLHKVGGMPFAGGWSPTSSDPSPSCPMSQR